MTIDMAIRILKAILRSRWADDGCYTNDAMLHLQYAVWYTL